MKFAILDLPPLPEAIRSQLITQAADIPLFDHKVEWLQNFHDQPLLAQQEFYTAETQLCPELDQELHDIYQPFFSQPFECTLGRLENQKGQGDFIPPHCDRGRRFAMQMILQTGGSNVTTVLYNEYRSDITAVATQADNRAHDQLSVDFEIVIPQMVWHAYDVQRFHAVKNLTGQRLILAFCFGPDLDLPTFLSTNDV